MMMKLWMYWNHICELQSEELYERRSLQLYGMQLLELWKESLKFTYRRSRHRPLTDSCMIPTISLRILEGSCQRLLKDTCLQWRSFKDPYMDPLNRASDRVRQKMGISAAFSREIMQQERSIMQQIMRFF